jgi:DNA gyrase subunit A
VEHRHDVVVRRTRFDLKKAQERMHIVQGLLIAQENIDEVVQIIRSSRSTALAKQALQDRFSLSEIQSTAIVEMRLRQLTGLEREKLENEHAELERQIAYLNDVLASVDMQMQIIKDELQDIKA